MISSIISRLVILVFGTLYPAYASYKAVRTKNVKEYVKWMMYWIVFALFTCAETFTDVFCSFWFPFYYEFKVILVLWLLSPATKGSSILYRKFVHPMLTKREQEIDEYIAKAKEQGYHTVLTLGSKGVNYATTVIMQTAIKGGGGLVNQLRRSYSLSDISADMDALAEMNRIKALPEDELDLGDTPLPKDPRLRRSRGYSPRRSASGSGRVEMYFPEVDVNVRQRGTRPRETGIPLSHIRSTEDVSSGYSSAEMLYSAHPPTSEAQEPLVRTSSVGSSRVTRTKVARGGATPKRPTAAEDNLTWSESEEPDFGTQEEYFYDVPPASHSEPADTAPSRSEPSHPIGSDFKSHVPIALVCAPSEQVPVLASVTSHSNTGLDGEQSTPVSSHSNEEEERRQLVAETLLDDKTNTQERKSFEDEFNTHQQTCDKEMPASDKEVPFLDDLKNNENPNSGINLISKTDIGKEQQPPNKEMPASDREVPFLDDLKNNENPKSGINLFSKTDIGMEQQPFDKEMLTLDSEVSSLDVLKNKENPNSDINLISKTGIDKEQQPSDKEMPTLDSEVLSLDDLKNNETLNSNINLISKTDHGDEENHITNGGVPQEVDDIEFFDTENEEPQNSVAVTVHNNILPSGLGIQNSLLGWFGMNSKSCNEVTPLDNEVSFSDVLKNNEIFKSRISTDFIPITVLGEEVDITENLHKSSTPQELEDIEFFDTESDLSQNPIPCTTDTDIVLVTSECSPINVRENQNGEKVAENNAEKIGDESCKEGRAGRYNKHPAPSPPPKSSTEALHLIVPEGEPDGEGNLSHELLVPEQKSPSPKRDKSGSKSPQPSPNIHKKNVPDDKSEHKSSVAVEEATTTESANTQSPGTVLYTEKLDTRPSEFYYNQYRPQASPNQPRKETKSKQDTRFFSRILAKPKSQLASFFPFFSAREEPQPLGDALSTSLTSLDDMRAQERARSSSVAGSAPTGSDYMPTPPELPPRRRTPDHSGVGRGGAQVNIREMSHSPHRRAPTSD